MDCEASTQGTRHFSPWFASAGRSAELDSRLWMKLHPGLNGKRRGVGTRDRRVNHHRFNAHRRREAQNGISWSGFACRSHVSNVAH